MTSFSSRDHFSVCFVTVTISFIAYMRTLCPSIAGGDSGELVAEGCQLGTSHPPGYPLYTIIVYVATHVAKLLMLSLSPAYAVNVTSAIFGSFASGLLSSCTLYMIEVRENNEKLLRQQVAKKKDRKKKSYNEKEEAHNKSNNTLSCDENDDIHMMTKHIAVLIGLLNAFSPLNWQYHVTAEVFALHNLFVALILHTTLRFASCGKGSVLLTGAFVSGLALTNQHTSILVSFPLILWVLHVTKIYLPFRYRTIELTPQDPVHQTTRRIPLLFAAMMSFCSGLLFIYATLPIFAIFFPHAGSWGDVSSLSGVVNHFLRKDYGSLRLYSGNDSGSEGVWERTMLWGKDFMWTQSNPFLGVTFIIASTDFLVFEMRKRRQRRSEKSNSDHTSGCIVLSNDESVGVDTAIGLSLLLYLGVFHFLSNLPLKNPLFFGIHQRFWMHPNMICFVLSGVGVSNLCKRFTQRSTSLRVKFCSFAFMVLIAYAYQRGSNLSDQSHNVYFKNYASSILKTLPQHSVLFINYDQQWTSIRYMQECEGVRTDITSINLSMMSYGWWSTKHRLYPDIYFPGSHYSSQRDGGFTFAQLMDANKNFEGKAFIGGNLSHRDEIYETKYDEVPHGIVRRIIKKEDNALQRPETFRRQSKRVWQVIAAEHSTGLPSVSKYGPETWEWTIRREFFEHFVSRATHLLDLAVSNDHESDRTKIKSIVEALSWLEAARLNDDISDESAALWKNLGIAYLNMVRNKEMLLPKVENIFSETANEFLLKSVQSMWWNNGNKTKDWKSWSSLRWQQSWNHFLGMHTAKKDHSYEQVKNIFDTVLKNAERGNRG